MNPPYCATFSVKDSAADSYLDGAERIGTRAVKRLGNRAELSVVTRGWKPITGVQAYQDRQSFKG